MKYSKEDRCLAAEYCAIRSGLWSRFLPTNDDQDWTSEEIEASLGIFADHPACDLAHRAFSTVPYNPQGRDQDPSTAWAIDWAEAEALIRTGWSHR